MITSRRLACASFLLITLLAINFASIEARRFSSGGRSRSSGSGRNTGRVSSPRQPVYIPKTPVYVPKPPAHVPPRQPTSSGTSFPQPHTPHNPGSTSGKDSSHILINAEGGGRPRPGSGSNDKKPQSAPHQPSAPYDSPVQKVNAGHVQSGAPTNGSPNPSGSYPPWANPSANPQGSIPSAPHIPSQPHGTGFPSSPYNPSYPSQGKPGSGPLTSAPYPPTHPAGPIAHPNVVSAPHPNTYPHPNAPYPSAHPQGMPMPSAPHIGFGNNAPHQPIGAPQHYPSVGSSPMQPHGGYSPPPTIVHNHYNAPPIGTPQNPAGQPMYGHQPAYGGGPVPMGQPYVPGQTVVVLPNQQSQDSGRGLGQLFKEALVYSTVNAGVNRIINGAPHHHHDGYSSSQPAAQPAAASTTSTVTNTVIYNQYGTPNPGANGIPAQGQPAASATPGNSAGTSLPSFPSGNPNSGSPTGSPSSNPSTVTDGHPNPSFPHPGANPTSGTQNPGQTGTPSNPLNSNNPAPQSGTPSVARTNNTNNETAPPAPEFVYFISNEELWNLTESLFAKDEIKANQYVRMNLQKRSVNPNVTDEAPQRLLNVRDEAYALPTIQAVREMYDNYEYDSETKEISNSDKRRQENVFLDTLLNTNIMTTAMKWLSNKGYVESDDFEWKDTLRHIWLSKVNGATCGFERIFLAEKYPGPSVIGAQNWIYFDSREWLRKINYMSYVDKVDLGDKATLVKINFKIDDVPKANTTMLVGTPPELEMALYTVCYYARPNDFCSVSLNGTKFNIYTHSFRYFGKDVMDLGLMFF
ncbi:poly(U)-specific endoribonuclease homolog [Venturia canescens]|uniref:poly(U)-specific endoribonuclease homolog n=1 Tax=Venturia canescens TaxID=32260 RepID=UPI001C9CA2C4|nr:poly(U)-specific endoribonuclease homolog [Venturia canescens]